MIKQLLSFFLLISPFFLVAQPIEEDTLSRKSSNSLEISGMYQRGHVFATNDFVRGINTEHEPISNFQAFSLSFSKQTTGESEWEQRFLYPKWGLGIYLADFYEKEQIGLPIALYGVFQAPFYRWEKLSLNYNIGFGATFNWKPFDPVSNQFNIALGAGRSFLVDLGMNISYPIGKYLELGAGFSLTHFSNGGLKQPNYGINTVAPRLNLAYKLAPTPPFEHRIETKHTPGNEWLVGVFAGSKNVVFEDAPIEVVARYEGVFFPVLGVTTTFNRHITYKSKIGLGAALSYDGSTDAQAAVDEDELEAIPGPIIDKLQFSSFLSYELVVNKFALILQPSFYIARKKTLNQTPTFHQRIGIKYHFMPNIFAGITLRTYQFHVSDFVEWNIGYRFGS
ncbi:MAG: acyloxyacyl hydrolase [Lewinella sp.]|uniref:acyloxyacyl hydrolase n=1 Tax=Lewinella sp. TaxID=2004506 RepID=UPI003D6B882D